MLNETLLNIVNKRYDGPNLVDTQRNNPAVVIENSCFSRICHGKIQ